MANPFADTVLALFPAVYYRLNDVLGFFDFIMVDSSDNNFDGEYFNGPISSPMALVGDTDAGSIIFDGLDDLARTPEVSSPVNSIPPLTLMIVLQTNSVNSGVMAVANWQRTNDDDPKFDIVLDNGVAGQYVHGSSSVLITGGGDLRDDEPHLIVAVFAADNDRTLYVDGVEVATSTVDVTVSSSGATRRVLTLADVGRTDFANVANARYGGLLAEAAIFNSALSASDVANLWNASGIGGSPPPPSPSDNHGKRYWKHQLTEY